MKIGIIGLPLTGKTTFFNLLTELNARTNNFFSTGKETNVGVARVPDPRIDQLSEIFQPEKTTYATIEFADLPGINNDATPREKNNLLAEVRNMDALLHVVRVFPDPDVPLHGDVLDPEGDLEKVNLELILSDLEIVENKLSRVKKGQKIDPREKDLLIRCQAALEEGKAIRELNLSEDEGAMLRGYAFLSQKPLIIVLNLSDDQFSEGDFPGKSSLISELERKNLPYLEVSARMEMEINQLDPEERTEFLQELNIQETGISRLARLVYGHLNLISFFTVGKDEVRAWTVKLNTRAKNAAGVIHSDIERGFIKADVIGYEEFIENGSLASAREKGLVRMEGKDYIVKDGDIISFRFNV